MKYVWLIVLVFVLAGCGGDVVLVLMLLSVGVLIVE